MHWHAAPGDDIRSADDLRLVIPSLVVDELKGRKTAVHERAMAESEMGLGAVPETRSGRQLRDALGAVDQRLPALYR